MLSRRIFLASSVAVAANRFGPAFADTQPDPRMADRAVGLANATTTAAEWFSFTCHFCAHFKADVYPEVKARLIDTGRLRLVFHEYPRDQIDLMAAMVARSLPAERYEPFMDALLATQAHWAFDRSVDPKDVLAKMAALAGMPREVFDRATTDDTLKSQILAAQQHAEQTYSINSTPTFIVNGQAHTLASISYEAFANLLPAAP